MADKNRLRVQRRGIVINRTSRRQEKALDKALVSVCERLEETFPGICLAHRWDIPLRQVIATLRHQFPDVDFHHYHARSSMRPDGGILSLVRRDDTLCRS